MPRPKKLTENKTVSVSVTRPKKLIVNFDRFIRMASQELDKNLNHSQIVVALEEMVLDNPEVYHLLLKKLNN